MPFLGVTASAGQVAKARVPIAEYADGTPVSIPVAMIRGSGDGPTLYLQGGLHGDESTGIEICRGALAAIDPGELSGTVVAVPIANVPAHLTRTRGFLHEERWMIDINRIFPGSPSGLLTERIADRLFTEFVLPADVTVDLHAALDGCTIAPFIYIDPDDDEHGTLAERERIGRAFGTPYLYYKPRGDRLGTSDMSRTISSQADLAGKVKITAEMGESRRATPEYVRLGIRGVENVLRELGMLPGEPTVRAEQRVFRAIKLAHAERGGGLIQHVDLGQEVRLGERLATVVDVFGEPVEEVLAPCDGFVLRKMLLSSVHTGAEVAWIAQ